MTLAPTAETGALAPVARAGPTARAEPAAQAAILDTGRRVLVRPLAAADERFYPAFGARVSAEDRRLRFFSPAHLSCQQVQRLTRYDRGKAAAFLALDPDADEMLGVARLHRLGDGEGEFAVVVRSDLKGRGIGRLLMERLLEEAPTVGVHTVLGVILRENRGMVGLAEDLGFAFHADHADPGLIWARRELGPQPAA